MTDPTASPEALVTHVCPKIRDLGWAFYFAPSTLEVGKDLGLDGFRFYYIGRGGVLGDVEPRVVSSAFGYFNPSLVADMWTSSCQVVAPRVAGRAFVEAAADYGRAQFTGLEGLEAFVDAADAVNGAADPVGLALYAAASAEALATDAPGRSMQLLAVLRELRGSAHLVALRACGLDDKRAQFIKRPGDAAMFGWTDPADHPQITDADRAKWDAAEALTDELVLPAYAVLDAAGRAALAAGVDAIEAVLTAS
jgi:hypothetical protein